MPGEWSQENHDFRTIIDRVAVNRALIAATDGEMRQVSMPDVRHTCSYDPDLGVHVNTGNEIREDHRKLICFGIVPQGFIDLPAVPCLSTSGYNGNID